MMSFLKCFFLGRLLKENGIMDLLKAMMYLKGKPIKLFIAGNGNLENPIREYIRKEQLQDTVKLLGIVRGQDKIALLQNADISIRTSYHEVFPVAYLEAISYGMPVIATPVGDTEYLAEKSGAIKIVPLNAPREVAQVIEEMADNKKLPFDVISRSKAYIREISWKTQAKKTNNLFKEILQEKVRGRKKEKVYD